MIITSVLRNLLWALRYPSFPSDLVGEYSVGAIQTRIPTHDGPACQIHYPTSTSTSTSKSSSASSSNSAPYIRPKAVAGLADYSRQPVGLMEFLSKRQHPCAWKAPPHGIGGNNNNSDDDNSSSPSNTNSPTTFPIVVFSHGLGGCMEMYTALCQQIASQGYWVVAVEHADGSGAYAETIDGESIFYKRPDDTPYSRNKVVQFRRPFLNQRVAEIQKVLDYLVNGRDDNKQEGLIAGGKAKENDDADSRLLQQVFQAADTSQGIHLVGHSFGGATMALATQKDAGLTKAFDLQSLSLMDCWAFSLDDPALEEGIALPTLSLLSEAWLTNPETAQVKELLRNTAAASRRNNNNGNDNNTVPPPPPALQAFHIPNSVHASYSDAVHWLPGVVARRLGLRAPNEAKHVTIRTAAQACVQHMRQETIDVKEHYLQDFLFENKATSSTTTTTTTKEGQEQSVVSSR